MNDTVKLSTYDSFDRAKYLWTHFEEESDYYVFQSFNWLKNWHDFIGSKLGIRPCITVVEKPDGHLLMLLPLGIWKHRGTRCLTWLGGKISDYHGPLLSRDFGERITAEVFASIWEEVLKILPRHDVIMLEKQPAVITMQDNPFLNLPCAPHPSNGHIANLPDSFDTFLRERRNSKWIGTHKRKQRRLASHGKPGFMVATAQDDVDRILATMIRQKSQSYRAMGVPVLFEQDGYRDFIEYLSSRHITDSPVHLSALTLDETILATHWGLVYKGRFYYLLPSYEHGKYSEYSPGTILLQHLFDWCIRNGVGVYDFTDGDEPYKFLWSDQEIRLYDYFAARTFRGVPYVWLLQLKRSAKLKIKRSEKLAQIYYKLRSLKTRWKPVRPTMNN
jgi:CelD/BcsL family acetyltransferase involved in cellulose biosynthesis